MALLASCLSSCCVYVCACVHARLWCVCARARELISLHSGLSVFYAHVYALIREHFFFIIIQSFFFFFVSF